MNEADGGTKRSKWQENHGNVLLGFLGVVLVLGAVLVVYRQNQAHTVHSPPDVRPRVYGPVPESPEDEADPSGALSGEDDEISPEGSELDAPANADSAVDSPDSAVDGSDSAMDGSDSAMDGSDSAVNGSGPESAGVQGASAAAGLPEDDS